MTFREGFSDKNVLHEHGRRKKTWKYLREDWHHRIKCTTATLLAAFMWKRRLNNTILANATHKELGKVADGTSIQVRVQMINRWRVKMIQKGLYRVGDYPRKGDWRTKSWRTRQRPILGHVTTKHKTRIFISMSLQSKKVERVYDCSLSIRTVRIAVLF